MGMERKWFTRNSWAKNIFIEGKKNFSFSEIILKLLSNPSIASKRWIYKQYDSQVQANTVFTPGKSDAAVVRLREQNK